MQHGARHQSLGVVASPTVVYFDPGGVLGRGAGGQEADGWLPSEA